MTRRAVVALALATVAAGCATVAPPSAPVAHAYVLLGPDGAAVARAVVAGVICPELDVDGVTRTMSLRAPAQMLSQRPGQAKPSDFLMTVCEAALPAGARRAAIAGRALPLPVDAPSRIVVLGDTGCRLYAPERAYQLCNEPARWPFAEVAKSAAAARPDLVIHVGDYHYRESACPPTLSGCAGSPWGYGFDAWEADFLAPARPLLAAAPWIVVRGNHETCGRAGQGWWRLLDPRPLVPRQDCNDAADDDVGNYSEPYAVPLGQNERAIVFDSSNAGNLPIPVDGVAYRTYRAQLARAFATPTPPAATYFVVHHPPLAFAANPGRPDAPYPGNAALQATAGVQFGSALFPPSVAAVFSGHNHAFQAVTFTTGQPPQFVFGDGGTAVDQLLPTPFPPQLTPLPGAVVRELRDTNRFGYATLDRAPPGWTLTAYDAAGVAMLTCTLIRREAACTPIAR